MSSISLSSAKGRSFLFRVRVRDVRRDEEEEEDMSGSRVSRVSQSVPSLL